MSPVRSWSERRKEAADAPAGFKPLEPGVYNFVIKEAATVRPTNAGKSSWSVKPTVEDGPRANATIFHDFYDSDKPRGVAYLLEQFSALGLDALLDTEPSDEAIAHALQGRRFSAEVYDDTYNGKVRQKLRNLRAPAGPPIVGPGSAGPALGGPGGPSAGPSAGPAPQQYQQPVQQAQPPVQQYQQAAPQQYAQQPVQQAQVPAPQVAQPQADNPWATGGAPPLPQF